MCQTDKKQTKKKRECSETGLRRNSPIPGSVSIMSFSSCGEEFKMSASPFKSAISGTKIQNWNKGKYWDNERSEIKYVCARDYKKKKDTHTHIKIGDNGV